VPVVNGMTARIVMWARCWDRSGIHSTAFPGRAGRRRAGKKPGHSAQDDGIYEWGWKATTHRQECLCHGKTFCGGRDRIKPL
jgi:hypothetical protein